jgi:hypothetical protein
MALVSNASGMSWYTTIVNYIESFQFSEDSYIGKFFALALGERGKNVSVVDGICTVVSTTGTIVTPYAPKIGIPLIATGSILLFIRRGLVGALAPPLLVVTAAKNPTLALSIVKEITETLGGAAKEAVKLGFQVSGLLVTSAGVVVGLVLTEKK